MPLIPIDKGLYKNVGAQELLNPAYAVELQNIIHNDAGSNCDRPGLRAFASIGNYPVIGESFFNEHAVAVTEDRRIWSIDEDGDVTELTDDLLEGTARPTFASDGDYIAIAGGGEPQRWDGDIANLAEAMPGSPPDTAFISYVDGYWIVNNDGLFYWAGPTAALRESFAAYFSAENLPDGILSQAVLLREFYGFGEESIQIFQNFGDSVAPWRPTFFIDDGIVAPNSVVMADKRLHWINQDRRIMKLEGRSPVHISPAIDKVIQNMGTVSDCWAAHLQFKEFYLIAFTFPTEEKCFVYDYKRGEWYEWDSYEDAGSTRFRCHSHVKVRAWGKHLVGDPLNGTIWELTFDAKADGSLPLRRRRLTGHLNHGTDAIKKSSGYTVKVERGVGTPGETEPTFQMRVNDDNEGWTPPVSIGLGFPGSSTTPIQVEELQGRYKTRQLEISMTDEAAFKLISIDEKLEAEA